MSVIPAQAGILCDAFQMDPVLRRDDVCKELRFLRGKNDIIKTYQ